VLATKSEVKELKKRVEALSLSVNSIEAELKVLRREMKEKR
jgi:polyhydroxyalkanoate synthesis regulator phasin